MPFNARYVGCFLAVVATVAQAAISTGSECSHCTSNNCLWKNKNYHVTPCCDEYALQTSNPVCAEMGIVNSNQVNESRDICGSTQQSGPTNGHDACKTGYFCDFEVFVMPGGTQYQRMCRCLTNRLGYTRSQPASTGGLDKDSEVLECDAGFYATDSACVRCPPGTFSSQGFGGNKNCICAEPGEYSLPDGTNEQNCPKGYFAEGYGNGACDICPAGWHEHETGTSKCNACHTGQYSSIPGMTTTTCQDCETGKFQAVNGSSTCDDCPRGFYFPHTKGSKCLACSSGTVQALEGQTVCTSCGDGVYMDQEGQSQCKQCPGGKYANKQDDTSTQHHTHCPSCQPGYITPSSGMSVCEGCKAGKFNDIVAGSVCKLCPAGKHTPNATELQQIGQPVQNGVEAYSLCIKCARGHYSASDGSIVCRGCGKGTYADVEGLSLCKVCDAGKYNEIEVANECHCSPKGHRPSDDHSSIVGCEKGKYQDEGCKYDQCKNCPVGYFQEFEGSWNCSKAPKGAYAPEEAMEAALACPFDTHQPQTGQTSCDPCGPVQYTDDHRVSCNSCFNMEAGMGLGKPLDCYLIVIIVILIVLIIFIPCLLKCLGCCGMNAWCKRGAGIKKADVGQTDRPIQIEISGLPQAKYATTTSDDTEFEKRDI